MKFLNYLECLLINNNELKKFTSCSDDSVLKFMLWANLSEVSDDLNDKQ